MKPAIGSSLQTDQIPKLYSGIWSSSVRQMFRYVEWIVIAVYVFYYVLLAANNILSFTAEQFWQLSTFYVAIAALSWICPLHHSLWIKQIYIFLEIALCLALVYFVGIHQSLFIYLYIAKSCFLFRRKSVIILATIVGILYVMVLTWSLPKITEVHPQFWGQIDTSNPKIRQELILGDIASYVMSSSFVIVFSSTLLAEQRSRQRAEELTRQVEGLAAQLERVRIARDIHDSLGHTLTNLQVQLALAQEFRQHQIDRAFKAVDMAKFLADQCVEDISLTLKAMHQSDFNLDRALQNLLEQLKHHQGLKVYSEINLPQLTLQVSHHLYCIIKEGLTNIQKHSNADRIFIQCQATSNLITVRLEDNGQGFTPALSYPGFGLQSMKERVQILEGELKIHSILGTGTEIEIVIPKKGEIDH